MQAIAITPRQPRSARLLDVPLPSLDAIANGRGVLVKVLRVGVDGTDKELQLGLYGAPPAGCDYLIEGHESLGQVQSVGPHVREFAPGDLVVATVRRPGHSLYDLIGEQDMTTDDTYYERGINLLHGYLTEAYVESADYLVKIPPAIQHPAVMMEPFSIVQKGIAQAYAAQRRMRIWRPLRAAVTGAGSIGLLASLALRLRGLEVVTFGLRPAPNLKSQLLAAIGATHLSSRNINLTDAAKKYGPFDLIIEATGYSPMAFEAMQALAKNGVLVWASVTGGNRTTQVPADQVNLEFVLGNKLLLGTVNASREDFVRGVSDMALAEALYPGWLERLLTHPVAGLGRFQDLFQSLLAANSPDQIKVFCELA